MKLVKSQRRIIATQGEVDLIKSYLIKYYSIWTSKKETINGIDYRMLSIRTFTPKELKQLHRQVKHVLRSE